MDIETAKALKFGDVVVAKNKKGKIERWRVNGTIKLWKRSPAKIRIPIKHGLYIYGYLDENNINLVEKEG